MMNRIAKSFFTLLILCGVGMSEGWAQGESKAMTIDECVSFALENHANVQNALIDAENAEHKVKETTAIGLPQLNGKWDFMRNIQVQQQFVPANAFEPGAPEDLVVPVAFAVDYSSNLSATLSQLVFDASYIIGLRASKTYKDLFEKSVTQSKEEVIINVKKAYYGALIAEERSEQLTRNLDQLQKLLDDTQVMFDNGLVEKVDLQRISVNINNLKVEIQKITSFKEVSYDLLKFQMGMKVSEPLTLAESLQDKIDELGEEGAEVNYLNRVDYQMLTVQEGLAELTIKNEKGRTLPSLGVFYNFGMNMGANDFGDALSFGDYKGYQMVGFALDVPIFSSGQRKFRILQAENELVKLNNSKVLLENSIDMQAMQAQKSYNDNRASMEVQKENVELAEEVYRVTKVKYDQGLGSNFEVVESENALKDAQTNYYQTVYDALVAKVDLDQAKGTLVK